MRLLTGQNLVDMPFKLDHFRNRIRRYNALFFLFAGIKLRWVQCVRQTDGVTVPLSYCAAGSVQVKCLQ